MDGRNFLMLTALAYEPALEGVGTGSREAKHATPAPSVWVQSHKRSVDVGLRTGGVGSGWPTGPSAPWHLARGFLVKVHTRHDRRI